MAAKSYSPDIEVLRTKWLCANCTGDAYLRRQIEEGGELHNCSYCAEQEACIVLGALADLVDEAFQQHFERTSDQPDAFQSMMLRDRESDYEWEREGDEVEQVIAEVVSVEEAVADDLHAILEDKYDDFESAKMGEETEYQAGSHYERTAADSQHWDREWHAFGRSLRTESRFFNERAAKHLSSVFDGIEAMRTWDGKPLVVEAGPGTPYAKIFRGRVFQSHAKLMEALPRPDLHLGSPPSALAAAGRMNARGVSVFYGANDADVAIAEVRPPVGSWVAVAAFEITRPLKLLDLTALERLRTTPGSYFDPAFTEQANRAAFLRTLSSRITRPVMPDDEAFDYLATQAVADFLAARPSEIDGILFPSVQADDDDAINMVLFHKAARVREMVIPQGATLEANDGYGTEDGFETDYSVVERLPLGATTAPEASESVDRDLLLDDIADIDESGVLTVRDPRKPTLSVQLDTLQVHEVGGVKFTAHVFPVRRHRLKANRKL